MKRLRVCLVAALGSLASFVVAPLFAQQSFIDVGTLAVNSDSRPATCSRSTTAARPSGTARSAGSTATAHALAQGQLIDLGVLPGLMFSMATRHQRPRRDRRVEQREFSFFRRSAVLWQDGQPIDLTPARSMSCGALAINKRGDIVGHC